MNNLRTAAIAYRASILNEYLAKRTSDPERLEDNAVVLAGARRELKILAALPVDCSDVAVRQAMGVAS